MNSCGNIPVVVQNVSELPSAMFSAGCCGSLEVARTRAAPAELRHQSAAPIWNRERRGWPSPVLPVPGSGAAPEQRGCGRARRCRSGTLTGGGSEKMAAAAAPPPQSPPRGRVPSASPQRPAPLPLPAPGAAPPAAGWERRERPRLRERRGGPGGAELDQGNVVLAPLGKLAGHRADICA